METREVHQGVGGQEEVGGQNTDSVEVSQHDKSHGGSENEDVSSEGVVVGVITFLEEVKARVDVVLADCLEDPGSTDNAGDAGGEAGFIIIIIIIITIITVIIIIIFVII